MSTDAQLKDLSARFRKYRSQGPRTKVEPTLEPTKPTFKGPYPHVGYLSNAETHQERFERLVQAQWDGYQLDFLDNSFLRECYRKKSRNGRFTARAVTLRNYRKMERIMGQTKAPARC